MKELILDIVNSRQGIKQVDLALAIYQSIHPKAYTADEILIALEELVSSGEIVELAYVLPQLNYREKSMYFPRGTNFSWKNQ